MAVVVEEAVEQARRDDLVHGLARTEGLRDEREDSHDIRDLRVVSHADPRRVMLFSTHKVGIEHLGAMCGAPFFSEVPKELASRHKRE